MTYLPNKHLLLHSVWIALFCLVSCKQEAPKAKASINTFSMRVNDQQWTPFQQKDDPCSSTYSGSYATISMMSGEIIPFYTVRAYRDPQGKADADSENLLRMRVMNVTRPSTYLLDGTYKEDFDSYLMFQMQKPNFRRYVNDPARSPFVVNVQEFIPIKGSPTKGIKGSFSGILYNEKDPSDVLVIEKGTFVFGVVNFGDHCGF
jgi:hypothetical protein